MPPIFFKHTIGITHTQSSAEDIVRWFSTGRGHYSKTQHLHSSQHIIRDDDAGLIICLKLVINYELIALLLGFCPDVSVLQPQTLADKLDELPAKGREVNRVKGVRV